MSAGPHLVASVAMHGWGHLSQTVPILAALHARMPGLRVTVRTGLPADLVAARCVAAGMPRPAVSFDDTEFGFAMHDAVSIDQPTSLVRYAALHADRRRLLTTEREALRALQADLLLADIGWLPIAAAASLGMPAFGVCSLNWADLLEAMWPGRSDVAPIVGWMRDAYASADALFALTPGMPFERYPNRVVVAPIARRGAARREALRTVLGVPHDTRIMQVAFGGLPLPMPTARWQLPPGWFAVVLADGATDGPSVRAGLPEGWTYLDLLASADLLVAKPGYGTFAEAGFAARDTLAVPRDDWPEAPYLSHWLARHARLAPIELEQVRAGRFEAAIATLRTQPARGTAEGDGATQVADAIVARLAGRTLRVEALSPP